MYGGLQSLLYSSYWLESGLCKSLKVITSLRLFYVQCEMNWLCLTAGIELRCLDAEHIAIRFFHSTQQRFAFFFNSLLTIKYAVRLAGS